MRGPQHAGRRNASWSGLDMEPQEIANLVVGQFEIGREKAGTPVLSPRFSGFSLTEGLILVLKPQQGDSAGVRVTEAPPAAIGQSWPNRTGPKPPRREIGGRFRFLKPPATADGLQPVVKPDAESGTPGLRVPASLRPGLLTLISFRPRQKSRPDWAECKHRDACQGFPPSVMHRRVDD